MIQIEKSLTADSRTAPEGTTKDQLFKSSVQHIGDVQKGLAFFADMLRYAGYRHDHTKLEYIDEFYEDFSKGLQGEDFKKAPWFQIHLTERHHLTDRCPDDVNLIDVLERVADICMAGMGRSGKVFDDELDPEILEKAYKNTIKLLIDNIEVAEDTESVNEKDPIKKFQEDMGEVK